jgi:predicted enzyme related to lactoylglutathione lyase
MPERDGYLPGVPCWADTSQPDPKAATEFYGGLFGWEFESALPEDYLAEYYTARIDGRSVAAVGSIPEGAPEMAVWNTYIWVESADETASKVKDAGGSVVTEPFDIFDSGRMAVFADPEGAVICVWQANEHKGAQLVNEPGSVSFNGLNTRDVEAAKKFYGSVFGWETIDVGEAEMFTMPGYGDHLESIQPGTRERNKGWGSPEGYEEVVATIAQVSDDQPDTPAHWSVTIATDDPDATAEKATELGGKLIVPPFDAPWIRMTVISDPQGAMFIASKFTPENKDLPAEAGATAEAS